MSGIKMNSDREISSSAETDNRGQALLRFVFILFDLKIVLLD